MIQRRHIFRFADFEADLERFQLQRGHRPIKLERIPLDLLLLLLSENGDLVSREQIVAKLWGNMFLDTERAINTAVRKVRKALGDDADHPHFIETVVGKGYRFIAPLMAESAIQNLHPEIQSGVPAVEDGTSRESTEIRLRSFSLETTSGAPVLTCDVIVGNMALGRLPLLQLELPDNVALSPKREDRSLPTLHGVRITLTAYAGQALHTLAISVLQSGLRTRATGSLPLSEEMLEKPFPADAHPKKGRFCPPPKSESTGTH